MSVPRSSASEWFPTVKKIGDPMQINIFATSPNPQTCARNLDSRRVVMQLAVVAVLLSAVDHKWHYSRYEHWKLVSTENAFVRWLCNDAKNIDWLVEYSICLLVEYGLRYGKHRDGRRHAGSQVIYDFIKEYGNPIGLEPLGFINSTIDERFDYRHVPDAHAAYRSYLSALWFSDKIPPSWGDRLPPAWYVENRILTA